MRKILFILLICIYKLSAYEYIIYRVDNSTIETQTQYIYYLDNNNILVERVITQNGHISNLTDESHFFTSLGNIVRFGSNRDGYITIDQFKDYYFSDNMFLNDLYSQRTQPFLNFLYNENNFNASNYIQYDNYEILYNSEGLAVESIVDGVWAGLFDDSQKSKSGALYDKNGSLVYYNGKAVDPVTSFLVWLQSFTQRVVLDTFEEIRKSLITVMIVSVVLVLGLFRLVLELLPSSISPCRRRYYGGGRGSLPDYGDGSQVAASVRARLAAKNKALKATAEGRSLSSQSLRNGILFDLENNDR